MAQARLTRSDRFLRPWAAGVGFGLYGLLTLAAAGGGIHPALPTPAAVPGTVAPKKEPAVKLIEKPALPAVLEPVTMPSPAQAGPEPVIREIPQADPEGAIKALPFEFSLAPDPEAHNSQTFILKLKRLTAPWPVGEALVWWTQPGGRKTSIALKQLSGDVWVSRVALEKPVGQNRLMVVILGDPGGGRPAETLELAYTAELPRGPLKFIGQEKLGKMAAPGTPPQSASPPEPAAQPATRPQILLGRVKNEKPAWSVQTVVILVGLANLALLLPVLLLARLAQRFIGGTDPDGEAARLLYTEIFSNARLIEEAARQAPSNLERTGPLAGEKPISREMLEATVIDPPEAAPPREAPRPGKAAGGKDGSKKDATLGGDEPPKVDMTDLSF